MRISVWSSDGCSSDLAVALLVAPVLEPVGGPVVTCHPEQVRVDLRALLGEPGLGKLLLVGEEVVQLLADHHVLEQRDRTLLLDDRGDLTPDSGQPLTDFLGVGHGGTERDHRPASREMDNHLFPETGREWCGEGVWLKG